MGFSRIKEGFAMKKKDYVITIKGLQSYEDDDDVDIEMMAEGDFSIEDGKFFIDYDETEATGMEGSVTSVSFAEDQPEIVSMMRSGSVSTALVFEAHKRHHCLYNTPYMPFEICVHTLKVENKLKEEGTLSLDYVIEIRGAQAERTKFNMQILK